ncbi:DUF3667 domain-containing protein [Chitinophaga sp. Mgbs1]|uniref:DUF3667 domain-containing protein n=1 Tax=Chitinophaga solisilvae TaxID=1233460 RepID=A0A3S1D209_9BACT|nr:DUF3667 domain-containing protein [Chitinophaga solisilvae]
MSCCNCNQPVSEKFCGNCGQPAVLKRVDGHYILHEIQHILHFEKGILYTFKALLVSPGKSIREFITYNRNRLVKPVIFLLITSLIYTVIIHFFHTSETHAARGIPQSSGIAAVFAWVESHYGYANIIMGVFIGGWLKLMFGRYGYNFYEMLILLCFVMGMGMLILAVFELGEGLLKVSLASPASIAAILYCAWAIAQFFDPRKFKNYLLALMAYLLGMFSFILSAVLLGAVADLLMKHV